MKWLSYVLIIAGVMIILYPKASEWYDTRQQEKLMQEWEEAMEVDESAESAAQNEYGRLTALFEEAEEEDEAGSSAPSAEPSMEPLASPSMTPSASASAQPSAAPIEPAPTPIATIKIASIDLKLPVLEGATQKNMKSAAAHLSETAPVGEIGNAAIAAHRMKKKGSLFNRLDEVKEGDEIEVETKDASFTYTVYKVVIVEPTDVSVLNYNKKDRLLTLITCDPVVNPTHRLIVHAKLDAADA